ncbi:fibrinogen-like protein 1 [Cyclopterus lumpus]|uniref:fibrinogen-like protein 1 n=1 Tax=Cyclopterus lumpus TaxID=8103 RepID=UPI001486BFB9|nr:fibrinogen-like protein 1 [Cyclopterus lumpus]
MKSLVGYCSLMSMFLLGCSGQAEVIQTTCLTSGTDCTQIKVLLPQASSGVYWIQPCKAKPPFKVFCEMRQDGGWTVLQRRSGGAVSFDRKWAAYKMGFGNYSEDFWLGLKMVSSLTKTKTWTLRVDLWDHTNATAFAEYKNFSLGGEREAFKLHVGEYRGDAGDAIRGVYSGIDQNGFGFSTADQDNDGCRPCIFGDIAQNACTSSDTGGWWYSSCGSASLNGEWHPDGDHIGWASGLHWRTWHGPVGYSMNATRMMIKSV